jgi:endonuclease-3
VRLRVKRETRNHLKKRVQLKTKAIEILKRLKQNLPEAFCELNHKNPFELLVATILSAQCTDERVNRVTPTLFKKFPNPVTLANADVRELEEMIRSTGFYRNKAKNLKAMAKVLVEKYNGQVPRQMEELLLLPGVARKTANVVLGIAYGIPSGIVVDTHVARVARRLGLTTEQNPQKIEQELMELFPKEEWIYISHALVLHGRYVCKAKAPKCVECVLQDLCPEAQFFMKNSLQNSKVMA